MIVLENIVENTDIKQIKDKIFELKDKWTLRGNYLEEVPFYSLGAAGYMDISEEGNDYYKTQFLKANPILKENFSDLYKTVFKRLSELYQKDFELFENSAHPGFHIFLTDDIFEIALASRHVDLQYTKIDWQGHQVDASKSLSFTLYLELPKNGGGVYYWDLFYEDLKDMDIRTREEEIHRNERKLKTFKAGDLFVHDGHQYHQIAPFFDIEPEDRRISLQGHAIYSATADKYLVHW